MLGILRISIHAPAKGATGQVSRSTCGQAISIHAPAKGATGFIPRIRHISQYFNPRSREGSDCISFLRQLHVPDFNPRSREGSDGFKVSIHQSLANFNPRSREGSDKPEPFVRSIYKQFQSTLPRRERPYNAKKIQPAIGFQSTLPRRERRTGYESSGVRIEHFNPRSREGSDDLIAQDVL